MKLEAYVRVPISNGVQHAYLGASLVRNGEPYDIARPCFELIDGITAVPALGFRDDAPATEFILDLGNWVVVDMKVRGRNVTPSYIPTDDPQRLLPLAERYRREARHLDSLGVEQWFHRVARESSTDAHVARPALGSGQ